MTVLIAGSGIAGLTLGLTLDQLKIPFRIYERVQELKPLGVGINLQPNAIRELFDLGLERELDAIGVRTRQYGFYTKTGLAIWEELRGQWAGYKWPQYSLHRGRLQMMLAQQLRARAGADCIVEGRAVSGFKDGHVLFADGSSEQASLIIASDGIHSAIRKQMYPTEGEPLWNGAIMWRSMSRGKHFRGGSAMILAGHNTQRFVAYPISPEDPASGLADINWIAELRVDPNRALHKGDWNRKADAQHFADHFKNWNFGWIDCPMLIASAEAIYEYPMVDRDPLPRWTEGNVTLIGDAAHPTYPVGSSGASQAVIDARKLGAAFRTHGVTPAALLAYEAEMRPRAEAVIRANRGSGPDAVMQMVEDRCGGVFENIEDVVTHADLAARAEKYKKLSGFSIDTLNAQPSIIGAMT